MTRREIKRGSIYECKTGGRLDALSRDLLVLQYRERLDSMRQVRVGEIYSCPNCRKSRVKENDLKVFCDADCHDDFWSVVGNNYKKHLSRTREVVQ